MTVMLKRIVSFDGTHVAYDIKRNRTRWYLVFLHGAGGDLRAWDAERAYFHQRGISTIAFDLRGHGLSDRPSSHEAYDLENFAKDIQTVIRHEHIRRYVLVGHCFGGMVAMSYQKLFPNHARSYVFIDTTDRAPIELALLEHIPLFRWIINFLLEHSPEPGRRFSHADYRPFIGTPDFDLARLYSDIHHMTLRSWLFVYEAMGAFDGKAALRTITRPVLVIHGKNDHIFSEAIAEDIRRHLSDAKLELIPHANHIIVLNNPETLVLEIWRFLKRIRHAIRIKLIGGSIRGWLKTGDVPAERLIA